MKKKIEDLLLIIILLISIISFFIIFFDIKLSGGPLAGVVIGGLLALIANLGVELYRDFIKNKNEKEKEKIKIASELMGLKIELKQFLQSCFEAKIFAEFHNHKWLTFFPQSDVDRDEAIRFVQKIDKDAKETSQHLAQLMQLVGKALVLFPENIEIKDACEEIYCYEKRMPKQHLGNRFEGMTKPLELENARKKAVKDLQSDIEQGLGDIIENLIKAIRKELVI